MGLSKLLNIYTNITLYSDVDSSEDNSCEVNGLGLFLLFSPRLFHVSSFIDTMEKAYSLETLYYIF